MERTSDRNFGLKIDPDLLEYVSSVTIRGDLGGVQIRFKFPNGYGASVVKHEFSYGWEYDLWELAVLQNGEVVYNTPITNDVIGYVDDSEVNRLVHEIMNL